MRSPSFLTISFSLHTTLPSLEAGVGLTSYVESPTTLHHLAVAMAQLGLLEGGKNLHGAYQTSYVIALC